MYSKKKKKVLSQCVPHGFIHLHMGIAVAEECFLEYWNSHGWVLADSSCVFCLYFFNLFFFICELAFNSIGFVHLEAGMRGKWNNIDSERRSRNWETKPTGLTRPIPEGWVSQKFFSLLCYTLKLFNDIKLIIFHT